MKYHVSVLLLSLLLLSACQQRSPSEPTVPLAIVPQPQSLVLEAGTFTLRTGAGMARPAGDELLDQTLTLAAEMIRAQCGLVLTLAQDAPVAITVTLREMPAEAYELEIGDEGVRIAAAGATGVLYAFQTLRQMMPVGGSTDKVALPKLAIQDAPRFAYRGMHLDVGRHMYPVAFIKKYIDLLAMYKMNRFHWHLTEDQGWRIEIKRYPRLQEVAAYRKETLVGHYNDEPQQYDGQRYGGFYTQEEVRDIVQYAAARSVTVIPEIELPGHAQAALAAYPELSCAGGPIEVATKWGVFDEVYCPTEETFAFLEGVLTEVMALFPSTYIHIGGDECPKTRWKESAFCQALIKKEGLKDEEGLQSYFIRRIERFLNANGRQIIGWDEILEGGLAPNATVMSWRGEEGGIAAAQQRHQVIMTPTTYCYLDYYQSQDPSEPLAIGGFLPIEQVYGYNPVPAVLTAEEAAYIQGVQGNVWTEYMKTPEQVEYMAFPRALALAEIGWTPQAQRDFGSFAPRLAAHVRRLQAMGVNAANKLYDVSMSIHAGEGQGVEVALSNLAGLGEIRYTTDGSEPTAASPRYEAPVPILAASYLRAQTFEGGKPVGRGLQETFVSHLAVGKKIELLSTPAPQYSAGGKGALVNGVSGSSERYGDAEWLGFEGKDFSAIIELGELVAVSSLGLRFFNAPGQWIYPPKTVTVDVSEDGQTYFLAGRENLDVFREGKTIPVALRLDTKGAVRFVRVTASVLGTIPAGRAGAGHAPWLFVDELVLR